MKGLICFLLIICIISCNSSGSNNNCFPDNFVDVTVDLSLPEFIDLNVPGGWSYTNGGLKGLVIFRSGNNFKAFDRRCPEQDQASCAAMEVENNIILKCSCDGNEYNSLNGSLLVGEGSCFAKEYLVQQISSSVIRITNF